MRTALTILLGFMWGCARHRFDAPVYDFAVSCGQISEVGLQTSHLVKPGHRRTNALLFLGLADYSDALTAAVEAKDPAARRALFGQANAALSASEVVEIDIGYSRDEHAPANLRVFKRDGPVKYVLRGDVVSAKN